MRRWLALAAALVVAALVLWALLATSGSSRKPAAAPTGSDSSVSSVPPPALKSCSGGCGGIETGFNSAANNIINPSDKAGGALRLLAGSDCDSWDPARTSYGWCWNLQRLITRTLVGYTSVNGTDFKLGPDLATSLGRHNADYSQWTYTLKPGLRFQSGEPIRPIDVKYGIERLFAVDVINGGPSVYFINSIAHSPNYSGPYRDGDLKTITTTRNSITFRLSGPNADFDYLMALPASAPVPYDFEGGPRNSGAAYGLHPAASGPFEIKSYRFKKSIVFARNPYWRQSTDDIRHPLVDRVRLDVDRNLADIDRRLRDGTADARADGGVQTAFGTQILTHEGYKEHADDPVVAATRYLTVLPSVIPNIHCRRAIFYAIDKSAAVKAFGGAAAGVPASSMTPPGIDGYDPSFNPYPSGPESTGDIVQARAELRACGKPHGFPVEFIYATPSAAGPRLFTAEQAALGRVGIRLASAPGNAGPYGCEPVSPSLLGRAGIGLVGRTLAAEFPTGLGFYDQARANSACLQDQSTDLDGLHDPTVDRILIGAARGAATDADWRAVDRAVMSSATYLPLTWEKTLYYRNSRLTNITCDNALASGIYDFVNVGVR